jgi:hypothetical protein
MGCHSRENNHTPQDKIQRDVTHGRTIILHRIKFNRMSLTGRTIILHGIKFNLKSNIAKLKLDDEQSLPAAEILSEVFSDTPPSKGPPYRRTSAGPRAKSAARTRIQYQLFAAWGDGRIFSVKIPKSGTVDGLKKAIKKEKEHACEGVDADLIDLWKVQVSK